MLIAGFLSGIISGFFLFIDGVIYNFIRYLYEIFNFLANLNIFQRDDYMALVQRLYAILSVIMLFVLAYALLRAVVNPDEFSKGENSFPNMIKNILISLVIIALLPTVFDVAFSVQKAILNADIIGKVILPNNAEIEQVVTKSNAGSQIAMNVFDAFFYPQNPNEDVIAKEKFLFITTGTSSYNEVRQEVIKGASFVEFGAFNKSTGDEEGKLVYNIPFSTIAGIFVVWTLLLYCFDMGIRTVKLAFYQIIAPIPAVCRIIPNGEVKKVWNNWVKLTTTTFIDVFIRIFVMYLGVFFINLIVITFNSLKDGETWEGLTGFGQTFLAKAFLIMGVIVFIRNAPKIIQDLFGIDVGGMNLGLKGLTSRLSDGGALAAGSALGAGISTGVKNFNSAERGHKIRSALGGAIGGTRRGLVKGASAKSFADMKKSATEATSEATEKARKRQSYRASHVGDGTFGGRMVSRISGHFSNARDNVKEWAGVDSLAELTRRKEAADKMQGFYKTMAGYVEDNENVAAIAGAYKAEMERDIKKTEEVFDATAFNNAIRTKVAAMRNDARYNGMSTNELYSLAGSEINRSNFTTTRTLSDAEYQQRIQEKAANLERLDKLKKIATIKVINEKLHEGTDGRFRAIANEAIEFRKQNSDIDFVQDMNDIVGIDPNGAVMQAINDTINNGRPGMTYNDAIAELFNELKDATSSPFTFFSDSEVGKKMSGNMAAEIAKKVQEKKTNSGGN